MEERLMRRTLAAALLAAGMFATAACGNDDDGGDGGDGGRSTEEVCADLEQEIDPLMTDATAAMQEAAIANGQGDQAAAAEAALRAQDLVGQITSAARDGAADAEDAEFSAALNTFADEFDNLASTVATTGEPPDTTTFTEAADEIDTYCG
jgi:hypothetical protein